MLLNRVMAGVVGMAPAIAPGAQPAGATNFPSDDFEVVGIDLRVETPGTVTELQPIPSPLTGHIGSPTRSAEATL